MYFTSALVASSLALQASAFLLPLEVTEAAQSAKAGVESLWSKQPQIFELQCHGCPFAGLDTSEPQWEEDVDNRIRLAFDVDNDQSLTINGQAVFINEPTGTTIHLHEPHPIQAPQVRASDGKQTIPFPIGWALEIQPSTFNPSEPNKEVSALKFTVLDLKGIPVEVDTLKIDLLKITAGETTTVSIVNISPVPFEDTPGADCPSDSRWPFCRIRAIIVARIRAMLEAAKARADAAKGWAKDSGCKGKGKGKFGKHDGPGPFHGGPGRHGPHGQGKGWGRHGPHTHHGPHHGGHHGHHRLAHMLHQTLRFFIIPALLGVIGGLVASALGMLVGQFIVYIWTRFHRNGQRGNIRIIEIAVEEDEKDALVEEDQDLPPLYTDVEAVVVEDRHSAE